MYVCVVCVVCVIRVTELGWRLPLPHQAKQQTIASHPFYGLSYLVLFGVAA